PDAAFEMLRTGKVHAFASAREPLEDYAAKLPGSRGLTDAYGVNLVGIAIQQGHPGRLTYISEFVEEAKASGLVQRAIDRAGLARFRVAPSARTNCTINLKNRRRSGLTVPSRLLATADEVN